MGENLYQWQEEQLQKQQEHQEQKQQNNIQEYDNNIIQNEVPEQKVQEEAGGLEKKRTIVKNNMPKGVDIFSNKQSLLSSGKYIFFDKKGKRYNATRTTPSSKYMQPVIDRLKDIDEKLKEHINPNDSEEIQKSFQKACVACENYIDNRNPWTAEGKARLNMVKDFYAQIRHESVMFEKTINQLKDGTYGDYQNKTWLDVLRATRTDHYTHGEDGVLITKTGAKASDVYVVIKNGKKKFFKQNEKLPAGGFSVIMPERIKSIENAVLEYEKGNHTDEETKGMKAQAEKRLRILKDFSRFMAKIAPNDREAYKILNSAKTPEATFKILLQLDISDDNPLVGMKREYERLDRELKTLIETHQRLAVKGADKETLEKAVRAVEKKQVEINDSDMELFLDELKDITRSVFQESFATNDARIDSNEEISKRNVATSRMAKILGLEEIVAKSVMTTVTIDGKTMNGIMMEDGGTKTASDAKHGLNPEMEEICYSPESFKSLLNLQVLDLICGQIDRHRNNYMAEWESEENPQKSKKTILYYTKFKGIDNDMSFGNIGYKVIQERGEKGYNRMRNIELNGRMSIPYMDYNLAVKILALNPAELDYQMADLLSKNERKALIDRINGVKKVISRQFQIDREQKRIIEADNGKFLGRFINETEDKKAWSKAYNSYKNYISNMIDEKGVEFTSKWIKNTTYLNPECIR